MDDCPRILVADEEPDLLSNLVYAFEGEGYSVEGTGDGESAWEAFLARHHDLAVLDILMPRADGVEVLRRIRSLDSEVPVIFLISKDEEFDKVLGLELGTDDYLTKPISMRELQARVRALLRRSRRGPTPIDSTDLLCPVLRPISGPRLVAGGIELELERFEAKAEGATMRLTVTEFRVLAALVAAPGVAKTRDALVAAAYPEDIYLRDRAIDCHVKRLRRKIADGEAIQEESRRYTAWAIGSRSARGEASVAHRLPHFCFQCLAGVPPRRRFLPPRELRARPRRLARACPGAARANYRGLARAGGFG